MPPTHPPPLDAGTDDTLSFMVGSDLPSELARGVVYRLGAPVGKGGMSVVFLARRLAPEGSATVVVKVLRPSFVLRFGEAATLTIRKEAVALGRLNERVPPTPFVVRLLDTSEIPVQFATGVVRLPFVVLEYVHGGSEGTTLAARVQSSMRGLGHAFDAARAAHAIDCIGEGLQAVHDAGVIHRDLTPKNVLACGLGDTEIFKIADFGVARPVGLSQTLAGQVVGTVGYAAPEISVGERDVIGPHSDVFSYACLAFYLLTGEHYFPVRSMGEALSAAMAPERRSILSTKGLAPEIRARPDLCKSIDFVIGWGSSGRIETRLQLAPALSAMLVPALRSIAQASSVRSSTRSSRQTPASLGGAPGRGDPGGGSATSPAGEGGAPALAAATDPALDASRWRWTMLALPSPSRVVRSVAWDSDGTCLVATTRGLAFWSGTSWSDAPMGEMPRDRLRFVRRIGPARWMVGGDESLLAVYGANGVLDVVHGADASATFELLAGSLDDVAVLVATAPDAPITLWTLTARQWLKPYPLENAASVTSVARLDARRWIVGGRDRTRGAMVGLFSPLDFTFELLDTVRARAFLAASSLSGEQLALVAGSEGHVLWVDGSEAGSPRVIAERVAGGFDLSAAGLDWTARGWCAAVGRIWAHAQAPDASGEVWQPVFVDDTMEAPIISLFLETNFVLAMTATGAIVEGRHLDGGEERYSGA